MNRKLTLDQARAQYPHRFTMEHMPAWAMDSFGDGKYPAPQYRTDAEWYENTVFPGELGFHGNNRHCYTSRQTWPLGQTISAPYTGA